MICRALSVFLLLVLVLNIGGLVSATSGSNVEDRIAAAIGYIVDQSSPSGSGFLHGTNGSLEAQRVYAFDNGIVALALSSYQQTHNSEGFHSNLKAVVQFLQQAQTSSEDYREYYDASNTIWGRGDHLCYWNSCAINASFSAFL